MRHHLGNSGRDYTIDLEDMIEEVLRQNGFASIPPTLPVLHGVDEGENPAHDRRERLRDLLAGFGYAETIHYAFGKRADDAALPRLVGEGDPIALANPLSELYAVMRRSLVPNLVASAGFNANRGATGVRLFESGHLFPGGVAEEVEALALVVLAVDSGSALMFSTWEGSVTPAAATGEMRTRCFGRPGLVSAAQARPMSIAMLAPASSPTIAVRCGSPPSIAAFSIIQRQAAWASS